MASQSLQIIQYALWMMEEKEKGCGVVKGADVTWSWVSGSVWRSLVKEGHPCDPEQVPKADRETQHGDCHRDLSYVLIPTKETKGWGVIHKLSRDLLQNISLKTCTIRPTALDMG